MKRKLSFLLLAAVILSGCGKLHYYRTFGFDIAFGPSSSGSSSETKASYSGEVDANKYERIDWNNDDVVRIYCPESDITELLQQGYTNEHYADYKINEVTASGRSSSAKVILDETKNKIGLRWGVGEHHFTALYPAPGTGMSGTSVGSGTVTCVLPTNQTAGSIKNDDGNITASPNPSYIFLAGYATAMAATEEDEEDEPVNIYFDPAVTTFEFTLQNNYSSRSNMTVASAGITTSDAGKSLAGTYTVNVTGIGAGDNDTLATSAIGTGSVSGKSLSISFSPALTIAHGKKLTFTLFAHPGYDMTKLTFWFIDSEGYTRSFGLKYKSQEWVNFCAFHKSRLYGIMAPESIDWTINMVPVVTSWDNGAASGDLDIDDGTVLTFSTPAVVSWGTGVDDKEIITRKN